MIKNFKSQQGIGLGFKLFVVFLATIFLFCFKLTQVAYSAAGDVTLTASAFSDPDAEDTFHASQWVIRDSESTVYDQVQGAVVSISVPGATFTTGTTYFWKVRYQDQHEVWGDYSAESSFVYTYGAPVPTPTPSGTSTTTITPTPTPSTSASSTPVPSVTASFDDAPQTGHKIYVPDGQIEYCR